MLLFHCIDNYRFRGSIIPDFIKFIQGEGKISRLFRNINIMLFLIVSILISVVFLFVIGNITDTVSKDYAALYSSNTVSDFNEYFGSQIPLLKKAAGSNVVIEWYKDELNPDKKQAAYIEMSEIRALLVSKALYVGIEKSMNEYSIYEYSIDEDSIINDERFFTYTASDKDYFINVDTDKNLNKKKVWLNYKVMSENKALGTISTWLNFSDLVENLFSEYDNSKVRSLIINESGGIIMDSADTDNNYFNFYSMGKERLFADEFNNKILLTSIDAHLQKIDGYFDSNSAGIVIKMSGRKYRYATIAPIEYTSWSVITLYNISYLYSILNLLPLLIIVIVMFINYVIANNLASYKIIFSPIEKLTNSIAGLKESKDSLVYGLERSDEIGKIAAAVQDMKDSLISALSQIYYDALTCIYNRRYFDENLERITKSLSRYGGVLSFLMIDVDFFKNYNDTYGHDMGDICLKNIATALNMSIGRADDFVARFGGEEFAVILPNTDENGACKMAEFMLENIRSLDMPHSQSAAADCITVSIGVTTSPVIYPVNGEKFIKRADEALYISKNNGRNKYTFLNMD